MRLAIWIVLWLLTSAVQAATVRIATYNLQNFTVTDRQVAGEWRFNHPKPVEERTALVAVIRAVNPDILAVQELGPAHLGELRRDLAAAGLDYPFAHLLQAEDDTRCVAIFARVPVVAIREHRDLPVRWLGQTVYPKRGLLEVEFVRQGVVWSVFACHLKSRLTDDARDPESAAFRTGEAKAIAAYLRQRWPEGDGRFLLVGDINDTARSPTIGHFRGTRESPLARDWPALDSRGERWTYRSTWNDAYERIDYLFVSPAMEPFLATPQAQLYDGPEATQASDHRLLWVDLEMAEASPSLAKTVNEPHP